MELEVRVPGSCGELLQGFLGDTPVLLTCPIDRYSTVRVRPGKGQLFGGGSKAQTAFLLARKRLQLRAFPYDFYLTSELPQGKGMASSSADIGAVLAAVQLISKNELSEESIFQLATTIEPTDPVFCQGLTLAAYRSGVIYQQFFAVPPLQILAFENGQPVDTLSFQQQYDLHWQRAGKEICQQFWQAVHSLTEPLTAEKLAAAATISSQLQAALFSKRGLLPFWQQAKAGGALGINLAHSGSVVGLLFSLDYPAAALESLKNKLLRRFPEYSYLSGFHLQSGGIFVRRKE